MPFRRRENVINGQSNPDLPLSTITLNMTPEEASDLNVTSSLISALIKNLLFQRNQIPIQFNEMERILSEISNEGENYGINPLESPQERRIRIKQINKRIKFKRFAEKFIQDFDKIWPVLETELMSNQIEEVNLMFGSSINRPREIYNIIVPPTSTMNQIEDPEKHVRKLSHELFRKIIFNEVLFTHLGRNLSKCNIFFAVKKEPTQPSLSLFEPRMNVDNLWGKAKKLRFEFQAQHGDIISDIGFVK